MGEDGEGGSFGFRGRLLRGQGAVAGLGLSAKTASPHPRGARPSELGVLSSGL